MRQLIIKAPKAKADIFSKVTDKVISKNIIRFSSEDGEVLIVNVNNRDVEDLLKAVSGVDEIEVTLFPMSIIPMHPPADQAPQQVKDVQMRSPMEIYLNGIQSVGSLFGYMGYAISAGIITWLGFYTNTTFLITASMIIAPFAGPAMNAAIGTAAGDLNLLKKSLLRYFLAILGGVAVGALLTFIFNLKAVTPLMSKVSTISDIALLLPLTAGFVGAMHLLQDDKDSLVSGTAVDMMVALTLAPPVTLLGIGLVLGNWVLIKTTLFLLFLQLIGIHITSALAFRFIGKVKSKGPRFRTGKKWLLYTSVFAAIILTFSMIYLQLETPVVLSRSEIELKLQQDISNTFSKHEKFSLLDSEIDFKTDGDKIYELKCSVDIYPEGDMAEAEELLSDTVKEFMKKYGYTFPVFMKANQVKKLE